MHSEILIVALVRSVVNLDYNLRQWIISSLLDLASHLSLFLKWKKIVPVAIAQHVQGPVLNYQHQ
jgi:hypothetical protein